MSTDWRLERVAQDIAFQAHHGQVDKAGRDYFEHPMRVVQILRAVENTNRPDVIAAAWLHDVLEDTAWTWTDLRLRGIPVEVCDAVEALSRRAGERPDDYYERVMANPIAHAVKLADVADNSNPQRLALLDEHTRSRLTVKYAKALAVLTC